MAATKEMLSNWFDRGIAEKATHMIVVCDTFDHEDYPVFVMPDQKAREVAEEHNGKNMQRIMECYDLRMDKTSQMSERRAFHWD